MRTWKPVLLTALMAVSAFAADVTGKWTAEMKTRNGDTREVTFNLKADGGKLTGSMTGPQGREQEIAKGKVDGDNVSFEVTNEFNGNTITTPYTGTLSGDELKLMAKGTNGRPDREMTAKRAK